MGYRSILPLVALMLSGCGVFGGSADKEAKLSEFHYRAKAYYDAGRLPQALDQIERGLELEKDDKDLITLKGYVLNQRAQLGGDPDLLVEARALFEKAAEASYFGTPKREAVLGLGMVLTNLALADRRRARGIEQALQEGTLKAERREAAAKQVKKLRVLSRRDLVRAEGLFADLLERDPRDIWATYHQATVKTSLDKYDEGLALLEDFLEVAKARRKKILESQVPQVLDPKRRDQLFAAADKLRNQILECHGAAANLLYKLKRYPESLAHLDEQVRLNPKRVIVYYNRARCYAKLGRVAFARENYKTFFSRSTLHRDDPRIKEALAYYADHARGRAPR